MRRRLCRAVSGPDLGPPGRKAELKRAPKIEVTCVPFGTDCVSASVLTFLTARHSKMEILIQIQAHLREAGSVRERPPTGFQRCRMASSQSTDCRVHCDQHDLAIQAVVQLHSRLGTGEVAAATTRKVGGEDDVAGLWSTSIRRGT